MVLIKKGFFSIDSPVKRGGNNTLGESKGILSTEYFVWQIFSLICFVWNQEQNPCEFNVRWDDKGRRWVRKINHIETVETIKINCPVSDLLCTCETRTSLCQFLTAWTRGVLIFKSSPISLSLGVINVDFTCPSFNWMMYVCWGTGIGGEDISVTTSLYFTNSLKCFLRAHCQSVEQDNVFLLTQMFSATCLTCHPYFYGFKIFWSDFMK